MASQKRLISSEEEYVVNEGRTLVVKLKNLNPMFVSKRDLNFLKLLYSKDKWWNTREIAEKSGLSLPSVSFYMNHRLYPKNLVEKKVAGAYAYYRITKYGIKVLKLLGEIKDENPES